VTGGDRGCLAKKSNRSVFAVHLFDFTALVAMPILVAVKRGWTLNEQPKPLSIQSKTFSLAWCQREKVDLAEGGRQYLQ
jgi:hypothetical protein